jgi:hypothetical protein
MPVQMTREEYEKKYGQNPGVLTPEARQRSLAEPQDTRSPLMKVADGVTNFIGARGIADQFGTTIASLRADTPQEKQLVQDTNPSLKEVTGSALQTGANFIPAPIKAAGLAAKAAVGAGTGYVMGVGSELQKGSAMKTSLTPGIETTVGGLLPVIGKIVGSTPKALERMNLRMTPTEQQNLAKNGKDVAGWLASQKIVGTPDQRLAKVKTVYNEMEEKVQAILTKDGGAFPKDYIIDKIKAVVDDYSDDPLALPEVDRAITQFETFVTRWKGNHVPVTNLNTWKRSFWERAFTKNKADVKNEADYAIGSAIKKLLDEEVPGLAQVNKEYSKVIPALQVLRRAASRNQIGVLNRALATGVGAAAGGTVGGFFGATVGGVAAERLASVLATPIRSATGAGAQTLKQILEKLPVDETGNIPVKLLLQALTGEENQDAE